MRIRPFLIMTLLLAFAISHAWGGGLVSADAAVSVPTRAGLAPHAAEFRPLQADNNTTAPPPSFSDLLPVIIFILAGVGIAIVLVAAGLWIARRTRRGKGEEGRNPGEGDEGDDGKNEDWGAKW